MIATLMEFYKQIKKKNEFRWCVMQQCLTFLTRAAPEGRGKRGERKFGGKTL